MNQCDSCDLLFLKDTKDRPYCCCSCELKYHWKQLWNPFEKKIFNGLKNILDWLSKILGD